MSRQEYVKCINRTMQASLARAWCGRSLFGEFAFQGIDHAAENNLQRGRLVPCQECVEAAVAALSTAPSRGGMTIEVSNYYLVEERGSKIKRYISTFKMTAEEAARRGLTEADKVPGTTESREPANPQSAGRDGARTTPK